MLPSTPCSAAYDSGELNLPCVVPEHLVDMADQVTLCSDSGGHTEALLPKKASPTPVPKLQLISLCLARLSEPITFTQIFPYVNEMMLELGVAHSPSQVGFYSGLVESVFAVSQLLTIYPFSRLSDNIGRRPVVLVGVIGVALSTIALGFSGTFTTVLIFRCLAGAFAGNVATMQAMLTEISDVTNQALMLPAYGLCWPVGSIIGPLIGGALSHLTSFSFLKTSRFLEVFPYFLPCFISGAFAFLAAIIGYFSLYDTLPSKCRKMKQEGCLLDRVDMNETYGTVNPTNLSSREVHTAFDDYNAHHPPANYWTIRILLSIPAVRDLTLSQLMLSFVAGGFDVLFVLFCYLPIQTGGLGYSIGYALAFAGTSAALLQILIMPALLSRCSSVTVYKVCMKLWPMAYFMLPALNIFARLWSERDLQTGREIINPPYSIVLWIIVGLCLAMTRVASLAFSLSVLLVKETSPSRDALGTASGLSQIAVCLARCIAPVSVSFLFAASIENNLLGSYLWVCVMIGCSCVGIYVTDRIHIVTEEIEGHK